MDDSTTPHMGESGNPIVIYPIQVRLARVGFGVALVLLICIWLFGGATVSVQTDGDSTVYTSESLLGLMFYVFPILTAILTIVYSMQRGVFRLLGVALGLITAWLIYTLAMMDTSNHNVTVTPTSVSREVGTVSKPIRHRIDFTTTAYLYVDEIPGERGPEYELVAYAADDGAETRVPIFDMMRAALPQIIETARKQSVIIGGSEGDSAIPEALRFDESRLDRGNHNSESDRN